MLLHQIPPNPPYLRAKVLRRLKRLGALAIKNSAYLLPNCDEALEDFQWLLRDIKAGGGDGWIYRAEAVGGMTDDEIVEAFGRARAEDYRVLANEATNVRSGMEWQRLAKRFDELTTIDFFGAPERVEVENLMRELERSVVPAASPPSDNPLLATLCGRTWVTRRGIKVDRISSAWLIRRFIDPQARFSFVDPDTYRHQEGELRFDMFEGEFTHRGNSCTFEVLLEDCGIQDIGLRAIAEIVHDLDMKEEKYNRPETAGIAAMIDGLMQHTSDTQRLTEGSVVFGALYARAR